MKQIYASDISGDFLLDSKGFLKVSTNEETINDQIKFLFTTFRGEILFKPYQGNSLEEELWEIIEGGEAELNSTLTELLERNIPYIKPTVSVSIDKENQRTVIYEVKYTINNDPNMGQIYKAAGEI